MAEEQSIAAPFHKGVNFTNWLTVPVRFGENAGNAGGSYGDGAEMHRYSAGSLAAAPSASDRKSGSSGTRP